MIQYPTLDHKAKITIDEQILRTTLPRCAHQEGWDEEKPAEEWWVDVDEFGWEVWLQEDVEIMIDDDARTAALKSWLQSKGWKQHPNFDNILCKTNFSGIEC